MAGHRGGSAFAIVEGHYNSRIEVISKANLIASFLGLTTSESGCNALQWAVNRLRVRAAYTDEKMAHGAKRCALTLLPSDQTDVSSLNRMSVERVLPTFERYGFSLDAATCTVHSAYVGKRRTDYQWCRALRRGP